MIETKNANPPRSTSIPPTEGDNYFIAEESKSTASLYHRADEQDLLEAERVNRKVRFIATESDFSSGVRAGDGDIRELGQNG